ncbi:uncharacterized protein C1orf109-like [Patiria miniata]|uniref:Uncharacterized protein n=1 Tax=Patiria miniata TaxID=46514 RepID=A0A914BMF1_PATMI|nr:uncharacterized protein C1orf109-like [Patiria miniata]
MSPVRKTTSAGGEETIHKQLRRSFKMVGQQVTVWQEASERSVSVVQSLVNHAEQLQCCRRAAKDGCSDVLQRFPDLKDRLEFKLLGSMEVILARLKSQLLTMEGVCKKHTQHSAYSLNAYHIHYREVGVAKGLVRSATWPSIADMLQWLADVDLLYRRLYAEKQWLYDTISYDNLDEFPSLVSRWKRNDGELTAVKNVLAHVAFFMEDG